MHSKYTNQDTQKKFTSKINIMNKATFSLLFLLFSCSGEQPKTIQKEQSNPQVQQTEKLEVDVIKTETPKTEEPKKKATQKKEEELPEAFFIHEGGDIQDLEFDEEGNIIE